MKWYKEAALTLFIFLLIVFFGLYKELIEWNPLITGFLTVGFAVGIKDIIVKIIKR